MKIKPKSSVVYSLNREAFGIDAIAIQYILGLIT